MSEFENRYILERICDVQREPHCWLLPIEGYERLPLVSIDEATEALTSIIPDIMRKAFIAKKISEDPKDGLSVDESAAIVLYTMDWEPYNTCLYFVLNESLRQKYRSVLKPWYLYLRLLLSGLSKLPPKAKTVYRGVKLHMQDKYRKGSVVVWWAFSSCTTNLEILQSEKFLGKTGSRTLFTIECHSGKDIRNHSYYNQENEVLLPPACQFMVHAILEQNDGLQIIQLAEMTPEIPLLGSTNPTFSISQTMIDRSHTSVISFFNYANPTLQKKIDEYAESKHINLTFQNLTDQDVAIVVAYAIVQKACKRLDLSQNQITSNGFALLASAFKTNITIERLNVADNRLTHEAINSLLIPLSEQNSTLKELGLGLNSIKDRGTEVLAEILKKNQTLQTLGLNNNEVGDQGTQALMHTLANSNRGLRILNLSMNKAITDASIESIIDMLEKNQTIEELHLLRCGFSSAGKKRLETAAGQSERLKL